MNEQWIARIILVIIFGLLLYLFYRIRKNRNIKKINSPSWKSEVDMTGISQILSLKKPKKINKTEQKCREIIESIYRSPFPNVRPDFLKSPKTNKNLELDCYNENLKIALEYNGPQHYKFCPIFHKTKNDFYSQVHRDDWKRKKCMEMGIRLIEVPYWITNSDLEKFIIQELQKKKLI